MSGSSWGSNWRSQWRARWLGADDERAVLGPRRMRWWRFPWLGVLLILLGVALFARELAPSLSGTGLLLAAIGISFAAAWALGGARWAIGPAIVLLAVAAARLLQDAAVLPGEGWTALALAGAVALLWLPTRRAGRRRRDWMLWLSAILGLIGLVQLSAQLPGAPDFSGAWPLVLVGGGVLLVVASARRPERRGTRTV